MMCGNSSLPQPHTHPLELGSESLEAETFCRNQKGQMSCLSASLAARDLVPAPELGQSEVPIPDTKSGTIIYGVETVENSLAAVAVGVFSATQEPLVCWVSQATVPSVQLLR